MNCFFELYKIIFSSSSLDNICRQKVYKIETCNILILSDFLISCSLSRLSKIIFTFVSTNSTDLQMDFIQHLPWGLSKEFQVQLNILVIFILDPQSNILYKAFQISKKLITWLFTHLLSTKRHTNFKHYIFLWQTVVFQDLQCA
jgi:hypothetical protein